MTKKIIVAIDGYSSCGKSSMARALAKEIDYIYIDTGAMYRGVTLFALRKGLIQDGKIQEDKLREALSEVSLSFHKAHEHATPELYLNGENVEQAIRTMEVAGSVSPIAALGFVLENLSQRDYIDTHREVAPLRQAEDAIVLDNSHLTIAEQDALLRSYFERATQD